MALLELFAKDFSEGNKTGGFDYFNSGRVRVNRTDANGVEFFVVGSSMHRVRMERGPKNQPLILSCTCPDFAPEKKYCKHIWAALLEADRRGLFPKHELNIEGPEAPAPTEIPDWKKLVTPQTAESPAVTELHHPLEGLRKKIYFILNLSPSLKSKKIFLSFYEREEGKFQPGPLRACQLNQDSIAGYSDPADQDILWNLLGKTENGNLTDRYFSPRLGGVYLADAFAREILLALSDAKKLFVLKDVPESVAGIPRGRAEPMPYHFVNDDWNLKFVLKEVGGLYYLRPIMSHGLRERPVREVLGCAGKMVFFEDFMAPSNLVRYQDWLPSFKKRRDIEISQEEINDFLEYYFADAYRPALELPPSLQFTEHRTQPQVRIGFYRPGKTTLIGVKVEFNYRGHLVHFRSEMKEFLDIKKHERTVRDNAYETAALDKFRSFLPPEKTRPGMSEDFLVSETGFYSLAEKCLTEGWEVFADQVQMASSRKANLQISSGQDWFNLKGEFTFGGHSVALPQLLRAIRAGERMIPLGDGISGLLPEEWLQRFEPLAAMSQETPEGLRLSKVQALFFAAGLTEGESLTADQGFNSLKKVLSQIRHMEEVEPGPHFRGDLRPYQKVGLAWLKILSEHEIGGVLADDMGLGKTIQVLALLSQKNSPGPSLIVAPKSLVFNWISEAEKFAPDLKVLNYTGPTRNQRRGEIAQNDLILTTYQTLRADVEYLGEQKFSYLILDEAQFIKNSKSKSFQACRQIQALKKMALSGTPIENSVADLFSILSVVTPGLLSQGQASKWTQSRDPVALQNLSRALTPFVLRRTKGQVLKDLPEKTEQVLFCELGPEEKAKYDELKAHYWSQLSQHIESKGLAQSKIIILEALLRLRQAACHQGLLDKELRGTVSAKFELLLDQIETVIQDGHKALIFSQFTSLLGLLKPHLQRRKINFQYLDGKTQDRSARIEEFQNDPNIPLFLLSLKAGGVGLNLTAADYVFILDPWWNPAVESQAIDRTHRIGQNKKVFAYKIIAKDTVEEKILELQKTKKFLASTVIAENTNFLQKIELQDLRVLFE